MSRKIWPILPGATGHRRAHVAAALVAFGIVLFWFIALADKPAQPEIPMSTATVADMLYQPVAYSDIPGWDVDDHAAAWAAFRTSCPAVIASARSGQATSAGAALVRVCGVALQMPAVDRSGARLFFERYFRPQRVLDANPTGLLTAYYEPVVLGSRVSSDAFPVPLHRRPSDLVNLVDEASRGAKADLLTHARAGGGKPEPYFTRQQIDEGALNQRSLEIFYVADAVDRFFLQVQGSGIIQLPDGQQVRIGYDGKNGLPYTSVGRYLIDNGVMGADQMSLQALGDWLRADPARGQHAIWQNKSYVFFKEMPGASAPEGVMGVALTPLRSLAIDPSFHGLGLPVFVDAPEITHITGKPFRQLMIGQDVGSAIRGRQRGDIYAGSGSEAGRIAGTTKQPGRFFVLLPETVADRPTVTTPVP